MRVLLVAPKNNYYDPNPRVNIFGQGLPYISAALKQAGHEVFGINLSAQWCGLSARSKLRDMMVKAIGEYQPDIIGTGGLSAEYDCVKDTIDFARKYASNTPVILGGDILTYDREYIFSKLHPDLGVVGEADKTVVEMIKNNDGLLRGMDNISYWGKDGKPVHNPVVYGNDSLDNLPFPDYDTFNYEAILNQFTQTDIFYGYINRRPRVVPISLARACPYHCTFCVHDTGKRYRTRSIDSAIEEIKWLYGKYAFNLLFIYDEMLSGGNRMSELCQKLIELKCKEHMEFLWTGDLRVDHVDKMPLKEMKESGCCYIGYGIESGSQKVLDSMNKKITAPQIAHAIEVSNKAGIGVQGNIILGDPAETEETIKESISFYNKFCFDQMVNVYHVAPYPGSKLFEHCMESGIIKSKEWYYEKVGHLLYTSQLNMTKIPDKKWFGIINSIEQRVYGPMKKVKRAKVLSCLETKHFVDPAIPQQLRRRLFDISMVCPHCGKSLSYLVPLGRPRVPVCTACMLCNRTFLISPPSVPWRFAVEAHLFTHLSPESRLRLFALIGKIVQLKRWLQARRIALR